MVYTVLTSRAVCRDLLIIQDGSELKAGSYCSGSDAPGDNEANCAVKVTTVITFTTMELDALMSNFYDSRMKLLKVMFEFFKPSPLY